MHFFYAFDAAAIAEPATSSTGDAVSAKHIPKHDTVHCPTFFQNPISYSPLFLCISFTHLMLLPLLNLLHLVQVMLYLPNILPNMILYIVLLFSKIPFLILLSFYAFLLRI